MRTVAVSLILLLLSVPALADDEESLTKREAAALVKEYVEEDPPTLRRSAIVERLKLEPELAATPIKRACRDEETVGDAIKLAFELRLKGMFGTAAKHMDGDFEDLILDYGLTLREEDAGEMAWKRWVSKEYGGTSWSIANKRLLKHAVPLDVIEDIRDFVEDGEDDERRDDAAKILQFQLGVEGKTIDELLGEWDDIVENYEKDARSFRLSGTDLSLGEYDPSGPVIAIGPNFRLKPGSQIHFPATDEWQEGSFEVKLRVRLVTDCEIKIALGSEVGAWMPHYKGGEWLLESGNRKQWAAPAEPGEWETITFKVTQETGWAGKGAELRDSRTCTVTVGDSVLIENGSLNGKMERLDIWVPDDDDGAWIIGGIEYIEG